MKVLITGGAGFIGSRLARKLAATGADVRILDSLIEQVHGPNARFPQDLAEVARCVSADVRDRVAIVRELEDVDAVVHLAAETGTGQSMYAVSRYEAANIGGTATLMDVLVNERPAKLRKIIVASSRAIYGEGLYHCQTHGAVYPAGRSAERLDAGRFEPACPNCGEDVTVLPTPEEAPFAPSSVYGLTKQVQEQMVLMFAGALGLSGIALRYQNVYGPGQSLCNPYTGLLAVFSNLVREGKPLQVFEDGDESRDFIYVDDVVDVTAACLEDKVVGARSFNVGSGVRTSVMEVARAVRNFYRSDVPIQVTGAYRIGDIRHNCADIRRVSAATGFAPRWKFTDGLAKFLEWASESATGADGFGQSIAELRQRGLMRGSQGSSGSRDAT
jgi:dTDP-L-rhamnose 4-epimerase